MADRLSQIVVEVAYVVDASNARLSQDVIEVAYNDATNNIRLSQALVEVLYNNISNVQLSQVVVETLYNEQPDLRVSQLAVEVLRSIAILYEQFDTITFTQTVSLAGSQYNKSISQSLTFTDHFVNVYTISISQPLTFISTVSTSGSVHTQSISQSITFTQSDIDLEIYNLILSQSIIFIDDVSEELVVIEDDPLNQHINDILLFNDVYLYNSQLGNLVIGIPVVSYVIVPRICRVVLSVPELSIILPCPLLGDSQGNTSSISIKRTMIGDVFTYVKQSQLQALKYNFKITTKKALELRNFTRKYLSRLITLSNWKAESWLVYLVNNPVQQITDGLASYDNNFEEYINVELQFEGIKVAG